MEEHPEVDLMRVDYEDRVIGLDDAIDAASDRDQSTWLVSDGRRVGAVVPPDVLEEHDRQLALVMELRREVSDMGKHGDGKPADSKPKPSGDGGKHGGGKGK